MAEAEGAKAQRHKEVKAEEKIKVKS